MGCCQPWNIQGKKGVNSYRSLKEPSLMEKSCSKETKNTIRTMASLQQMDEEKRPKEKKSKVLNPKIEGLGFSPLIVDQCSTESEIDEELSILASEIVNEYDQDQKGYLKLDEFEKLVRQNLKKDLKKQDVKKYLSLFESSQKDEERTVEKFQIYALCKHVYN